VNPESSEFLLIAFAVVLGIYGAFMAFARWCFRSPAVPEAELNQLRVGMTQAEVTHLLGHPQRETRFHERPEWHYGHRLKRHRLLLRFDEDGLLTQFQHVAKADPRPETI
jgi:hypothetical protein